MADILTFYQEITEKLTSRNKHNDNKHTDLKFRPISAVLKSFGLSRKSGLDVTELIGGLMAICV